MKPPKISARSGLACAVSLGLGWAAATSTAQTFTTIKSFGTWTDVSGFHPRCQLVQGPDGTLYGTAYDGEGIVQGTVFKVQPDGAGFTALKCFTNWSDGANPSGGLILAGSTLYGATLFGGTALGSCLN